MDRASPTPRLAQARADDVFCRSHDLVPKSRTAYSPGSSPQASQVTTPEQAVSPLGEVDLDEDFRYVREKNF